MQEVNKINRHESRRMIMSNFNEFGPNLTIENTVTPKKRRELILMDHTKFAVELAKQSRPENTDTKRKVFKKDSKII